MGEDNRQQAIQWRSVGTVTALGAVASTVVGWAGPRWLSTALLGTLLSLLIGLIWQLAVRWRRRDSSLLETPFYLAHDAEIFDRYRRLAHEMLRISGRPIELYRKCALEALDASVSDISRIANGKIVFEETEAWRLVYEELLRDPNVTVYRSVALVRNPRYWQDGAGRQSMQLNFELLSQSVIAIERTVIISDELWPTDSHLPTESIRQWIHEQSVHGIWIRLIRESAIRQEPDLIRDMGIYGFTAVGYQRFDSDGARTSRFTLDFDFPAVREAEARWNRLNVYANSYRDLLDQNRPSE